jgi:hypothetical protein
MLPDASLIVVASPPDEMALGNRFPLPAKATVVGRGDSIMGVNITLLARGVARIHARIWPAEDRWMIRDHWTRLGTHVNGRRVTDDPALPPADGEPLADGDAITIHTYSCTYRFLFATEPFDRRWLSSDVVPLARGIRDERAWDRLGILSDALQDAGCEWEPFLAACSPTGNPINGPWVVDYLLREYGELAAVPSPLVVEVKEADWPGMEILMQPGRV